MEINNPAGGGGNPGSFSALTVTGAITAGTILHSWDVRRAGIRPKLHLTKLSAAAAPKVCIIGNSTGTDGAQNPAAVRDYLWGYIIRRMKEDNPSKASGFAFTNYAIGGTTFGNLQLTGTQLIGLGITLPSWFVTVGNTWLSYVTALQPDVLIFDFGINDSYTLTNGTIRTTLNTINGYTKVPDLIFCTSKGANPAAGAPYSNANYQAGYLSAAGVLRAAASCGSFDSSLVNIPPIGMIDIGRAFQQQVNGVDPVEQPYTQTIVTPVTGITTFPYTFPQCDGDFDMSITFTGQVAAMQTAGTAFNLVVASAGSGIPTGFGDSSNFLNVTCSGANQLYVGYYPGAGFPVIITNGNNLGGSNLTIRVTCKQDYLYVQTIASSTATNFDGVYPRAVGPMCPYLQISNPPAGGATMTIDYFRAGAMATTQPSLTALQAYGVLNGPNGGNGINHDGSIGLNAIDYEVLDGTDFCAQEAFGTAEISVSGVVAANTGLVLPPNATILQIIIYNTTANAITGGLKFGTTAGGTDIVTAQAVGANAFLSIADASILLRVFSTTASQVLYFDAVAAWNSANVTVRVLYQRL